MSIRDKVGTLGARLGASRTNYTITPGLYGIGAPTPESPVVVTVNYKLTFDTVRRTLADQDLWLLVVDTRGINVWCAAGKGTFSAEEIAYQAKRSGLKQIVNHRRLILPQLSAPGVSSRNVHALCGFHADFGPIRINDLPHYLANNREADEKMRSVTFSLAERAVLIPVELSSMLWPLCIIMFIGSLLSGVGPDIFSFQQAIFRSSNLLRTTLISLATGTVLAPICLPWLPFRQFWLKGIFCALGTIPLVYFLVDPELALTDIAALFLWHSSMTSYLAMNFTGSTPFTSLSGVEMELKRGLPFQILASSIAIILWLSGPFIIG